MTLKKKDEKSFHNSNLQELILFAKHLMIRFLFVEVKENCYKINVNKFLIF